MTNENVECVILYILDCETCDECDSCGFKEKYDDLNKKISGIYSSMATEDNFKFIKKKMSKKDIKSRILGLPVNKIAVRKIFYNEVTNVFESADRVWLPHICVHIKYTDGLNVFELVDLDFSKNDNNSKKIGVDYIR